jgi:[methyl-Co(III) methanol-specific corrinoid protein]:coenzyme M methyltransferase
MDSPLKHLMEKHQKGSRSTFQMIPFLSIARIAERGLQFNDILRDSRTMTEAALLNFEFGFESTVLPFDLNVEAEILGAQVSYFDGIDGNPIYPTIAHKPVAKAVDIFIPVDLTERGRMPVILQSVSMIKKSAPDKGGVGVFVPGPFTLASQVMDLDELFVMVLENPEEAKEIFEQLTIFIDRLKEVYVRERVDFIVVEDGVATSISPKTFQTLLLPYLQDIFSVKKVPQVISLTGSSDDFIEFMLECNPDGISVDQKCNIEKARRLVPPSLPLFALCGSPDMLASATQETIVEQVNSYLDKGVTSVGPPADIYPPARIENIETFVMASKEYRGRKGQVN